MKIKTLKEYSSGGAIFRMSDEDTLQVLLIRVRKEGFELPKGHVEAGETETEAAIRECHEEIGISSNIAAGEELGRLTYSFEKDDTIIEKHVVYFRIHCEDDFEYRKPKNTREVIWITEEIARTIPLVNEALRPLILKAFDIDL